MVIKVMVMENDLEKVGTFLDCQFVLELKNLIGSPFGDFRSPSLLAEGAEQIPDERQQRWQFSISRTFLGYS
jgi:hypothetical protein